MNYSNIFVAKVNPIAIVSKGMLFCINEKWFIFLENLPKTMFDKFNAIQGLTCYNSVNALIV